MTVMPPIRDPKGLMVIGDPKTPYQQSLCVIGATHIIFNAHGKFLGVYVDDDTPPKPDPFAIELRAKLPQDKLVVVGIRPEQEGHRIPGCVCAQEWYPFGKGFADLPLPNAEAYITQWLWAWPGHPPPTPAQRERLYAKALAKNPRFVWVF